MGLYPSLSIYCCIISRWPVSVLISHEVHGVYGAVQPDVLVAAGDPVAVPRQGARLLPHHAQGGRVPGRGGLVT